MFIASLKEYSKKDKQFIFFSTTDLSPLIVLFIISHLINVDYNVGRIVLFCFPFYLPLASIYLLRFFDDRFSRPMVDI